MKKRRRRRRRKGKECLISLNEEERIINTLVTPHPADAISQQSLAGSELAAEVVVVALPPVRDAMD